MKAKIELSEEELSLAQNARMILTKNNIIQKTIILFGLIAEQMQADIANTILPEEIKSVSPKISKGENYKGLPYVMLDYPRLFGSQNIFAIRTMFWWGNYFSTTLHLKGDYKTRYQLPIQKNISFLADHKFSISVSEDEWKHEHAENYISLFGITENELVHIIGGKLFLKISAITELSAWKTSETILHELFGILLKSISVH